MMRSRKASSKSEERMKYIKPNNNNNQSSQLIYLLFCLIILCIILVVYFSSHLQSKITLHEREQDVHIKTVEGLLFEIENLKAEKSVLESKMSDLKFDVDNHKQELVEHKNILNEHKDDLLDHKKEIKKKIKRLTPGSESVSAQDKTPVTFHTVVSCGCSAYQNWQVESLLYSWWNVGQPGKFTRLTSGCKNDEQRSRAIKTAVKSNKIGYYFTGDFAPPDGQWHSDHKFTFSINLTG
eukprot:UN25116